MSEHPTWCLSTSGTWANPHTRMCARRWGHAKRHRWVPREPRANPAVKHDFCDPGDCERAAIEVSKGAWAGRNPGLGCCQMNRFQPGAHDGDCARPTSEVVPKCYDQACLMSGKAAHAECTFAPEVEPKCPGHNAHPLLGKGGFCDGRCVKVADGGGSDGH